MNSICGRERVVQPYDPRGVLCAAFLWGVALGSFMQHAAEWLGDWLGLGRQLAMSVILIHVVVLWYAAVPLLLARVTDRMRTFVQAAVATNLGMFIGSFAAALVRMTGFGADTSVPMLNLAMLMAFAITSAIAIVIAMGVRWLYRMFRFVPVEEGKGVPLCMACAYELGSADPCPECGTLRVDAKPRGARLDRLWQLVQRAGRPALLLLLVTCGVYTGFRIQREFLPTRRFVTRFGGAASASYAYIDVLDQIGPGRAMYHNSIGATIDLKDGSGRMILVSFNGWGPSHLPVMQVRICAAATFPAGWPAQTQRMTDWGMPNTVVADLNRELADRVLRDGVPRGLLDAIVAKADEVGWKPGGGMQNVGGARLVINATPFFSDPPPAGADAAVLTPR